MNINSTFTSTRTAITVNTAQVWTSKAMAQRCGPMLRCALSDGRYSALPSSHVASKATEKSTITVRQEMKKKVPLRLFTLRDVIHKGTGRDASSSPSSSSSVCTAISPRNTCRCFASFPKTSDSPANRFSKQTRERLVAGCSQLPRCLPVSGDRREIGCEAERRSCINTDQRSTARLPASAITYSRGRGTASPSLTTLTTEARIITSFISHPLSKNITVPW